MRLWVFGMELLVQNDGVDDAHCLGGRLSLDESVVVSFDDVHLKKDLM